MLGSAQLRMERTELMGLRRRAIGEVVSTCHNLGLGLDLEDETKGRDGVSAVPKGEAISTWILSGRFEKGIQ